MPPRPALPRHAPAPHGPDRARVAPAITRGSGSCRASRRVVTLLLTCLLAVMLLPGTARAEAARWQWPLPPPHPVLNPFEAPAHRYGPGHRGIDIGSAAGAEVRAVEDGTVRFSGMVAGRGVVSVVHADGLLSTYEPVTGSVERGAAVRAGEVLGTLHEAADASHCTGATCLHLGARRGEVYLDPMLLLGARGPSVLLPWSGDDGAGPGPVGAGNALPHSPVGSPAEADGAPIPLLQRGDGAGTPRASRA